MKDRDRQRESTPPRASAQSREQRDESEGVHHSDLEMRANPRALVRKKLDCGPVHVRLRSLIARLGVLPTDEHVECALADVIDALRGQPLEKNSSGAFVVGNDDESQIAALIDLLGGLCVSTHESWMLESDGEEGAEEDEERQASTKKRRRGQTDQEQN